ncbi:MAG: hypothetical protein ABI830_12400 [Pseudolabrys sp.]
MRRILPYLAVAAAIGLATPAFAYVDDRYPVEPYAAPVAGAVVGTAVGVGLFNGWWGSSAAVAALPATAAGAAAVGGVAGVGTVALIDAVVQPCRGFHALLGMNHGQCDNGNYVGDQPRRMHRGAMR